MRSSMNPIINTIKDHLPSATKIQRVGLLVGSPLSWTDDDSSSTHIPPECLKLFWDWVLHLPQHTHGSTTTPCLGVNARGLVALRQILAGQDAPHGTPFAQDEDAQDLEHLRALKESFAPHFTDLAQTHLVKYANRVAHQSGLGQPHANIWLDHGDEQPWVKALIGTLTAQHSDIKMITKDNKADLELYDRYDKFYEFLRCTVFASLELKELAQQLVALNQRASNSNLFQEKALQRLNDATEEVQTALKAHLASPLQGKVPRIYLSWNLLAFDFWNGKFSKQCLFRPVLALWTEWPSAEVWAPPAPIGYGSSGPFTIEEGAYLLMGLLRTLRKYFLAVKDAFSLALTKPPLAQVDLYPPTFYFADPDPRATDPLAYEQEREFWTNIHRLLGIPRYSQEIRKQQLSETLFLRDMVAVRGEVFQSRLYKTRYLLLPTEPAHASRKKGASGDHQQDIDIHLYDVVAELTYLEMCIGLDGVDLAHKIQDITEKKAIDGSTIDTVDAYVKKLAILLPSLTPDLIEESLEEMTRLQLALGRVQHGFERQKNEALKLEQHYDQLLVNNAQFLGNDLTPSPIRGSALLDLMIGLKEAYPYRSLHRQVSLLHRHISELATSSTRVSILLTQLATVISDEGLRQSERRNRQLGIGGMVLAFVAFLVALPTFFPDVNAGAIASLLNMRGDTLSRGWAALILLVLGGLVLAVIGLLQGQDFLIHRERKRESECFHEQVTTFWRLAEAATPIADDFLPSGIKDKSKNEVDSLDKNATTILNALWPGINDVCRGKPTAQKSNLRLAIMSPWKMKRQSRVQKDAQQQGEEGRDRIQTDEDVRQQIRTIQRLIQVFVLRPERIPLPRSLCILRFKSLQFLQTPTISDNDFRDSLQLIGYSAKAIESLQTWLSYEENKLWIIEQSVNDVAQALAGAGVIAYPSVNASEKWIRKHSLMSYKDIKK